MVAVPYTTLGQAFLQCCKSLKKENFLIFHESDRVRYVTYDEMLNRIDATVSVLTQLNIKHGDRIICYVDRSEDLLTFSLACSFLGAIPVPLSTVFSINFLKKMFAQSEAKAIFTSVDRTDQDIFSTDLPILAYSPSSLQQVHLRKCTFIEPSSGQSNPLIFRKLEEMCAEIEPSDIMLIQPTSGSTGRPKLVLRKHQSFFRYAKYVGSELEKNPIGGRHRFFMPASLTHAFGWHMICLAIYLKAEITFPSQIDTGASLMEARELDPTVFTFVPRVARSLMAQYNFHCPQKNEPIFGPKARFLLCAGGLSDEGTMNLFQSQGLDVMEMYGSSEASLIALTPLHGWLPGHSGKVVDDVDIKFSADGEICVKSPGLMEGYFLDETATREAFSDGFYLTGDLGTFGTNGYLKIHGRKKDVFNTPEGDNIYPERIENKIEALPWVDQVIIVGDRRPSIAAFIVLKQSLVENIDCYIDELVSMHALKIESFRLLYNSARVEMERINLSLEDGEKIRNIVLLNGSFPKSIYRRVGSGKIRRNRKIFCQKFSKEIEFLYQSLPVYGVRAQKRKAA
jgi:long-chain acyl-CoA synthetase